MKLEKHKIILLEDFFFPFLRFLLTLLLKLDIIREKLVKFASQVKNSDCKRTERIFFKLTVLKPSVLSE